MKGKFGSHEEWLCLRAEAVRDGLPKISEQHLARVMKKGSLAGETPKNR
jgi:hypothetical protein